MHSVTLQRHVQAFHFEVSARREEACPGRSEYAALERLDLHSHAGAWERWAIVLASLASLASWRFVLFSVRGLSRLGHNGHQHIMAKLLDLGHLKAKLRGVSADLLQVKR